MKSGKKYLAIAAAVSLMGMTAAPAFAASEITKEETVYVVTEADGSQSDVTVSDHLANGEGLDQIHDRSNLKDIENVKGDETFEQGAEDALVWNAEGNDIFYQGSTDREVPVKISISYFLNGEEVQGSEMDGASGDVKIVISYRNTAVDENGTTVPFLVMTGFICEDDTFTDIDIDHGKVIDDGDKKVVAALAVPGLEDALDIDEDLVDLDLSDTVTITGTAKDFSVQDMMSLVTNSVFDEIDTDDFGDLDYDDEIKELDKGAKALMDGSEELYNGIHQLNESVPTLTKGITQLDNGALQLRGSLKTQLKKIAEAADQLHEGTDNVLGGLKQMKTGLDKGDGTASNPGAISALDQVALGLSQGAQQAAEGAKTLSEKAEAMRPAVNGLAAVDQGLTDGIAKADENLPSVESGLESLNAVDVDSLIAVIQASDMDNAYKQAVIETLAGYKQTANGAVQIADAEYNGLVKAQTGTSQIYAGLENVPDQLSAAASSLGESADGIQTASGVVSAVEQGLKTMSDSLGAYDKDAETQTTLIGGMTVITSGLDQMHSQVASSVAKKGKLTKALNKLVGGTGALKDGAEKLEEGTEALDEGSGQLSEGMAKLYKEGIKKIVDLYNDDLKGTMDDLEDVIDAGQSYKSFTELPDGMDGNVKFIYKTSIY
ncbi:MAG: hypothetical protein IJ109_09810 [Firmicutes bacterium]|nr:hypothetical protein [Bacillota bacterium]MBQ9059528.1 hypothetical protein [Bacillota bacterium]